VAQYANGSLILQTQGVYYEVPDSSGARALALYPAPSGGDTLELEWVYEPAPLTLDTPSGEPSAFPRAFHKALLRYAAAVVYGGEEDNPELAEREEGKFDLAVSDLMRYDNQRRAGGGVFTIPILGVSG
jgi:hypothetical protein